MNILAFTPYLYDTAPGQRFRIEQWARHLERDGVSFSFVPFESPRLKRLLRARGHHARTIGEFLRCVMRRVTQVAAVVRQAAHVVSPARHDTPLPPRVAGAPPRSSVSRSRAAGGEDVPRRAGGVAGTSHAAPMAARAPRWDVIFLYRDLLPIGPPILERWLARTGIPIVYDFDDAIFLRHVTEANRGFAWLKRPEKTGTICGLSAHVIVGNAYLQAYAARYAARVTVVPTTIDTAAYAPKESVEIDGIPTIGWSGSVTTMEQLRIIEPALKRLRRLQPFRLKVLGEPNFSIEGIETESQGWNAQAECPELRSFDIGVMPLPDNAWSRGKCGLKALQYMALGIPTVASPVGVNRDIIRDGANGFLAATESEWIDKLAQLINDANLRRQFARAGRSTVEGWYAAQVQAPRLLEVFQQVRRTGGERPRRQTAFVPPIIAGACSGASP
ncbi:MAG: glycosyltransferase family 4 protein [Candidatus Omnitrophica bacterium]|nr:glycosyltransferase family 4 protein [Candidatus Omnitrophota bacterium]